MNSEVDFRQAVDTVHLVFRAFLSEPTEENRSALVSVCKHFINKGFNIKLRPDGVQITRKEMTHGGNISTL